MVNFLLNQNLYFMRIIYTVLFLLINILAVAQKNEVKICAYREYITEKQLRSYCNNFRYSSNDKALEAVDNILKNVGLYRNFIIKECPGISNACAATIKSSSGYLERYIIYDKKFLDLIINNTKNNWSSISILAHEIGHHLNGHNLVEGITNHEAELQADEFSGFVLAKMGASLDESLQAIKLIANNYDSKSHPSKLKRIQSITIGWNKAKEGGFSIQNDNLEIFKYNIDFINKYKKLAYNESISKNYKLAAEYCLKVFQYSEATDFEYLYLAASNFIASKQYEDGLKIYLMLVNNGIKLLSKDKQLEVHKNIGLIYSNKNNIEDALKFFELAKAENPNDETISIATYNLFVDEGYRILNKDNEIVNEMNTLQSSQKDNKRFFELAKKRNEIFKSALVYFEKAYSIDSSSEDIKKNLLYLYKFLDYDDKYKKLKNN